MESSETADGGVLWIRDYFRVVYIDGVHSGMSGCE